MTLQRKQLCLVGIGLGDSRRTDFRGAGLPLAILGLEVEELGFLRRDDLDWRKRERIGIVAQHGDSNFDALNALLDQGRIVVPKSIFEGLFHLAFVTNDARAKATSLAIRFDDHRKTELLGDLGLGASNPRRFGFLEEHSSRNGNIMRLKERLATHFIHRQRRSQNPASGVGNPKRLQKSLNRTVLAARSMKRNEDTVGPLAGSEPRKLRQRRGIARRCRERESGSGRVG